MKKNAIYTISSLNYLHYDLTVRASFLKHNPNNYDFIIILMDMITDVQVLDMFEQYNSEGIDIRFFYDVKNELPDFLPDVLAAKYTIIEANTSIKPYCMEYLFRQGYEKVIYIDPDIKFYSPIDKLDKILDEYDVVLTPHMAEPYPKDGKEQNCQTVMQAGMYNCGFIAVKNSEMGRKLCKFWQTYLFDKCYIDIHNGLFTDQKWADWFPSLFDAYILKDRGHNAAYWNLHERIINKKDGAWYANDDKLVFYHFSGLSRFDMDKISKYQTRFCLSDRRPELKELFEEYLDDVNSRNADVLAKQDYFFNYIPGSNLKIPDKCRTKFSQEAKRKNLHLFSGDGNLIGKLMRIYLKECIVKKKRLKRFYLRIISILGLGRKKENFGVNFIGYFDEMHSIGELARLLVKKCYASGIPFSLHKLDSGSKKISQEEQKEFDGFLAEKPLYDTNIFIVNADQIPHLSENNPELFQGKYNMATWYWEFETGFEKYASAHKFLNEVFVSTDHIKKCIQKYLPEDFKVTKFLFPFLPNWGQLSSQADTREKYDIPQDAFTIFFNFDYNSSYDRKNPEAILKAFRGAFDKNQNAHQNAQLIIKTTNANNFSETKESFLKLIKDLELESQIKIVDTFLSRNEMISLINACDSYISLHRAEGFAMGCLEAMSLGKPVIATKYSGNLEFMNDDNSLLVDAPMTKAITDFEPYKDVEFWAEPDIRQASEYLQKLYKDREFALNLGARAKLSVQEQFSPKNFKSEFYRLVKGAR